MESKWCHESLKKAHLLSQKEVHLKDFSGRKNLILRSIAPVIKAYFILWCCRCFNLSVTVYHFERL